MAPRSPGGDFLPEAHFRGQSRRTAIVDAQQHETGIQFFAAPACPSATASIIDGLYRQPAQTELDTHLNPPNNLAWLKKEHRAMYEILEQSTSIYMGAIMKFRFPLKFNSIFIQFFIFFFLLIIGVTAFAQNFRVFASKGIVVPFLPDLLAADNNTVTSSFVLDIQTLIFIRTEEPSSGAPFRLQDPILFIQRLGEAPFWANNDWQSDLIIDASIVTPLTVNNTICDIGGGDCGVFLVGNEIGYFSAADEIIARGRDLDIEGNPNNTFPDFMSAGILCLAAGQYIAFVDAATTDAFSDDEVGFGQSVITVESLGPC